MELATRNYVQKKVSSLEICKTLDSRTDISDVSVDLVSKMLKKDFLNGPDMKALMCLFNTLIKSTEVEVKKRSGIDILSDKVNKWMIKINVLSKSSQEGDVYLANILSNDIQVVIKTPKKIDGYVNVVDIIREYYIGIAAVNKLRYIVPTFVYTLGAYVCPYYLGVSGRKKYNMCEPGANAKVVESTFVIYENIVGASLGSLLMGMKITFEQYLRLFIQILIGLEVAQREISFTHQDLHPYNVMVRSISSTTNASYKVPIDNDLYSVKNPDSIATIIDFGLSTVKPDKVPIGSYSFPEYGMLHIMVPGYDMYKLLTFSIVYASSPGLKTKLMNLLKFYGNHDPYEVIKLGNNALTKLSKEYCKGVIGSVAAARTPKMMLDWILSEYSSVLGGNIVKTQRNVFRSISYSSFNKEYYDILKQDKKGTDDAIEIAMKCASDKPKSYIMSKYYSSILKKYANTISGLKHGNKLDNAIEELRMYEDSNRDQLIELDKAMLDNVYKIKLPSQDVLDATHVSLYKLPPIGGDEVEILDSVILLDRNIKYEKQLEPYLQLYYTIQETQLGAIYVDWLDKFLHSSIWYFYLNNVNKNAASKRWRETLMDSLTKSSHIDHAAGV